MYNFYCLTLTDEQAQVKFDETIDKDNCKHILWLAYVFDRDPCDDQRAGDNGLYTVEWEFDRILGANDAFRAALNPDKGYTHECTDERVLAHIQKLVDFYGPKQKKYRGYNDYKLANVHPTCASKLKTSSSDLEEE